MARCTGRRGPRCGRRPRDLPACNGSPSMRATWASRPRRIPIRCIRTPLPSRTSRRIPATWRSRSASRRSCAGTRWRWSCARTRPTANSAATSPATRRPPRSSRSASTTSFAPTATQHGGDLVFFQPHSAPGVYARAFLEGRLDEEQLAHYRQEVGGDGLCSYPHPWLMPDFWQFPTGSMGIGPISAIYQARFMRYLEHRGICRHQRRAASGACSATARWTSPNRSAR